MSDDRAKFTLSDHLSFELGLPRPWPGPGGEVSLRHFQAACILLGVPPTQVDDVVDLHVSAGKIVFHVVHHDDGGKMIISKYDDPVLRRVEVDITL